MIGYTENSRSCGKDKTNVVLYCTDRINCCSSTTIYQLSNIRALYNFDVRILAVAISRSLPKYFSNIPNNELNQLPRQVHFMYITRNVLFKKFQSIDNPCNHFSGKFQLIGGLQARSFRQSQFLGSTSHQLFRQLQSLESLQNHCPDISPTVQKHQTRIVQPNPINRNTVSEINCHDNFNW